MSVRFYRFCLMILLVFFFSSSVINAEDVSYYLTEQEIWFVPEFFADAGAAMGALKNSQKDFVGWEGCPVRQIELDRYGLRVFGVLDTTYEKWNYTGAGIFGGHYETVPYHEEETTVVPFDQVRTMHLFYYPKLDRDNKYGLRLQLKDNKRVDFRAVDESTVKRLANAVATLVLASGNKLYPWSGISVLTNQKESAKVKKKIKWKEDYGAVIEGVVPESPAAGVGLKANDIVLEVNGVTIKDGEQLLQLLTEIANKDFSAAIEMKVFSGGETMSRSFKLIDPNQGWSDKSAQTGSENKSKPPFGISARSVSADDQKTLGLSAQNGLLVTEVKSGSLAEKLQIKVNDVILEVNGAAFKDSEEFKNLITTTTITSVKVFRGGKEIILTVPTEF